MLLLIAAPAVPLDCSGGPTYQGSTYAVISCTNTGITWSAHTSDFLPNTRITYEWFIQRNGQFFISGEHGGYYTNSIGNHFRLPSGFPQAVDCGPGVYTIEVWTRNDDGTFRTYSGRDEVACE